MFNKPVLQLNEEDIQTLINNKERESLILEYKQEIFGTDHEKKEISKDISAMANTEGGYLVIGIQEVSGQASTIVGTSKVVGTQPVEAWIESVLIANVRPKITIMPKVIVLTSIPDRVLVVIYIPKSSKRPHMVIAEGRNAYYTRHNYQATYADEHEVRSMFLESKSSNDEMKSFLSSRNLNNEKDEMFAITPLSQVLLKRDGRGDILSNKKNPFILFAACPRYLEERINIASSDFEEWMETNKNINLFGLDIEFLDYNKTILVDSIRSVMEVQSEEEENRLPIRYEEIFRNGYIENGMSSELIWYLPKLKLLALQLSYFTTALWIFIKFVSFLYKKIGYLDEVNIIIALVDIENVVLHGFGKKNEKMVWREPGDYLQFEKLPISKQKNVKIEKSIMASELNDENIEKIVKFIVGRVSNAFGERIAKCFDDDGNFNINNTRSFRNIH